MLISCPASPYPSSSRLSPFSLSRLDRQRSWNQFSRKEQMPTPASQGCLSHCWCSWRGHFSPSLCWKDLVDGAGLCQPFPSWTGLWGNVLISKGQRKVLHAPIKELPRTPFLLLTPLPVPRPLNDHRDDTLSDLRGQSCGQTSFKGQGTTGYPMWAVRWLVTAGGYCEILYLCFLPPGFQVLHPSHPMGGFSRNVWKPSIPR